MDKILDSLLDAANKHGKLQDLLREAWVRMAPNTRFGLLQGATVESMALSSAGKDFSQRKLVKALEEQMAKTEKELAVAGYEFIENEDGHCWLTEDEQGITFVARVDAIADAQAHFSQWLEQDDA